MPHMRSYRQFCPAARALDVVGERWNLLIVRELLFGPKRYTDLQDGLPGIGPNLLALRLRSLEQAGVLLRRRLPPPAASTVYELTALGQELRPVLESLFEWGLQFLQAPRGDDAVKASYWLPALQAAADPERIPAGTDDVYEFRVGEERLTASVKDGAVQLHEGPAESPDVVIAMDAQTFAELGRGRVDPTRALESGEMTVEGDERAAQRCAAIFAGEAAVPQPPASKALLSA